MISEFQDLSDKIDKLAQLTQALRSENYLLRQANALLGAENLDFKNRLLQAQNRVEALLAQLEPAAPGSDLDAPDGATTPNASEAAE